jgi:outer membrane autotransporter protein
LAVCAALEDKVKIGLKYELNSSVAILGGMIESSPYIGLNGATALSKDLAGMGELDFTINNSKVNFVYNLGLKYNLPQNIDLRGGLRGNLGEGNQVLFALGIGYKF